MSTLKLRLKRIDPIKYAIITGAIMALTGLIAILFITVFGGLFGAMGGGAEAFGGIVGGGIIGMIFVPIFYFIFGFIFGWLGTIILNFILKRTGGLDMEFENFGSDISMIGKE